MRSIVAITLAAILLLTLVGCERWALDRQMEELCKKDGGIKVYEAVILPATFYVQHGELRSGPNMPVAQDAWFVRIGLDDNYRLYVHDERIVGKEARHDRGEGSLNRVHEAIYRWPEKRLLGEAVWYARNGGDWFTLGFQPSGKSCPHFTRGLAQSIFTKGE